MKTIFKAAVFTICCGFLSSTGFAQDEEPTIQKKEEIIIQKNDAAPDKTIIEIDSNKITVNGKPLSNYNGDVTVLRRNFRNLNDNNLFDFPKGTVHLLSSSNSAFLGVLTAKTDKGVVIKNVIDSSAAKKAGLQPADVITKFGGKEISTPEDLSHAVNNYEPGDNVTVNYIRDGKSKSVKVELGKSPRPATSYRIDRLNDLMKGMNSDNDFNFRMPPMPRNNFNFNYHNQPKLGLKIEDTEEGTGVKVLEVEPGSAAEKAGLKEGDIITEMNGEKVSDVNNVRSEMIHAENKNDYKIKVKRDRNEKTFEVKIPKILKSIQI
jgi:serine protease Do